MRMELISEHITTIEKSMKMIDELSKEEKVNANQLVRWVMNKEDHASKIQDIVTQYFMTQRVKPVDEKDAEAYGKYVTQATLLQKMLVHAMKAKQSTDPSQIQALRALLDQFGAAYFGPEWKKHSHD
jgi:nickel superoxide dismutase